MWCVVCDGWRVECGVLSMVCSVGKRLVQIRYCIRMSSLLLYCI